ncbi:pendrin isoform X2 [Lingula anatina]|uniref:Pendrin isoform X2 n=1 Tax=Lingula anatina TaxID=7574 RepID=A0A1S3KHA3_LINAN|nr:pendrin isoform X2 [Lingula anatina]|eukprot:XP_013421854.1 pendrin isoform X2 [Lingula anatina]
MENATTDDQENSSVVQDPPKEAMITIQRPLYTQEAFDKEFNYTEPERGHFVVEKLKSLRKKHCSDGFCSRDRCRSCLGRLFPFIISMANYQFPVWLFNDLIAGLTVAIMHLPHGMAYGLLAGLPSINGLYVSFFPSVIYFFFGSSKHISLGTMAVVSLMVGQVVNREAINNYIPPASNTENSTGNWSIGSITGTSAMGVCDGDTNTDPDCVLFKVGVATSLAMFTGLWQLFLGIFGLGFMVVYLSDALISGFMLGAALYVVTSQIKEVFGIHVTSSKIGNPFKLIKFMIEILKGMPDANIVSIIMSILCMITLILVKECINARYRKKLKVPVPIELIVVILSTVITYLTKIDERYGVVVVGNIPTGIPSPQTPELGEQNSGQLIIDAFSIAIVAFTISISLAKMLAKKQNYTVDGNQELISYGICNVFNSFFQGFTCCAALSRSMMQEVTGGKTQVAGLISSTFVLIVILVMAPLFKTTPRCVLSSIIIVALKGMFLQVLELKRLCRVSKFDAAIWLVTFLSVVLLGMDLGLLVGVVFSFLTIILRTQWPKASVYGHIACTDFYRDPKYYRKVEELPSGVKIFHYESVLYYANAQHFMDSMFRLTGVDPLAIKAERSKKEAKKKKKFNTEKNIKAQVTDDDAEDQTTVPIALEMGDTTGDTYSGDADSPKSDLPVHHIILDCEAFTYIDALGAKVITQVVAEYGDVGISIFLANCKSSVLELLDKTGFFEKNSMSVVYLTVHDAVTAAQQKCN